MCGRFTLAKPLLEIAELVGDIENNVPLAPRYNIAPSQPILTVLNRKPRELTFTQWGLVPRWAKDPSMGSRMINARSETIAEKPAFRSSFKYHRCLILADGFFEWRKVEGQKYKTPIYIRLNSREPFAFAGIYADWQGSDGSEITTSAIITTSPNELVSRIHNRMPVILSREHMKTWMDPALEKPDELAHIFTPYPASGMEAYEVSRKVNKVAFDAPDCIDPVQENPVQGELF
jgi:putative SOS response-associated peptidase YedK